MSNIDIVKFYGFSFLDFDYSVFFEGQPVTEYDFENFTNLMFDIIDESNDAVKIKEMEDTLKYFNTNDGTKSEYNHDSNSGVRQAFEVIVENERLTDFQSKLLFIGCVFGMYEHDDGDMPYIAISESIVKGTRLVLDTKRENKSDWDNSIGYVLDALADESKKRIGVRPNFCSIKPIWQVVTSSDV